MEKRRITIIILLFIGIILILYPFVSNIMNVLHQTTVISNYQEDVGNLTDEQKQEELAKAEKYNEELSRDTYIDVSLENKQEEEAKSYLDVLDIGEAMGHLIVPKIELNLPIYHGLSNDVLQNGVGHAETSSLPVGGKGTHAVLAGHTGLARLKIFDDLNELQEGDIFYISILGNMLKYKIDNKVIVDPNDTETIKIVEDKDYVTLVTCIPKYINSHRLLVRGERVELNDEDANNNSNSDDLSQNANSMQNLEKIKEEQEILQKEFAKENKQMIINQIIKLIIIIMLLLMFIILIILKELKRRKEKQNNQ